MSVVILQLLQHLNYCLRSPDISHVWGCQLIIPANDRYPYQAENVTLSLVA